MRIMLACPLSTRGAMGDNFHQLTLDLTRIGAKVSAIVPGPYRVDEFSHCHDVIHLNTPKNNPLTYLDPVRLYRVRRFLRQQRPDVLLFYGPHPVNIPIAVMRPKKTRLACYVHDPVQHSGGNPLYERIYRFHDKWMEANADALIVTYSEGRRLLEARGVPSQRIRVVYLGFLENFAVPTASDMRFDFIFFGRLARYKGLDILADALASLHAKGKEIRGIIAGPGSVAKEAPALADLARDGKLVLHERYLPDQELSTLIGSARLTVLPYRDATGTQTVQIAAYHRRPVLATRVGCFPEYVLDNVTGRLVEPSDASALENALLDSLENPSAWDRMGEEAYRFWFTGVRSNESLAKQLLHALLHSDSP